MTDAEKRWRADGKRHGWKLPNPAPWPLRLPVVRLVRAFFAAWKVERHYEMWDALGMGSFRSGYDDWVLYGIATGKC